MEDEQQTLPIGNRIAQWINLRPGTTVAAALLLVGVFIIAYWAFWPHRAPAGYGFAYYDADTARMQQRTLWDWLSLLIVPAALAVGAYWLNRSQKETELKIAEKRRKEDQDLAEKARMAERQNADNRQQQATLEAYFDWMTELLLKHGLRNSAADSDERSIARARTITVVKLLDGARNGQLFAFLKAAKLMEEKSPIIDPVGIDFAGVKLAGANLGGANLTGASLSVTDLRGANLRGANMGGADLRGAEVRWANLSGANLTGTDFNGADLSTANLTGANLIGANLTGANLRKADLGGTRLNRCDLREADLSEADLSEADLSEVNLSNAVLFGAYLSGALLARADLIGADLSGANMWETTLSEANLLNTNLSQATLLEANLRGAKNWTIKQFDQAETLIEATMPDSVKLGGPSNNGPTYAEWKAHYLAKQGEEGSVSG